MPEKRSNILWHHKLCFWPEDLIKSASWCFLDFQKKYQGVENLFHFFGTTASNCINFAVFFTICFVSDWSVSKLTVPKFFFLPRCDDIVLKVCANRSFCFTEHYEFCSHRVRFSNWEPRDVGSHRAVERDFGYDVSTYFLPLSAPLISGEYKKRVRETVRWSQEELWRHKSTLLPYSTHTRTLLLLSETQTAHFNPTPPTLSLFQTSMAIIPSQIKVPVLAFVALSIKRWIKYTTQQFNNNFRPN